MNERHPSMSFVYEELCIRVVSSKTCVFHVWMEYPYIFEIDMNPDSYRDDICIQILIHICDMVPLRYKKMSTTYECHSFVKIDKNVSVPIFVKIC